MSRRAGRGRPRPISGKILPRTRLAATGRSLRRAGKRVVFTNGCFDLLHPGHIGLLEAARRKGDVLVVGLNGDGSVRRLKGTGRPILLQRDRARMLAALECVDYVTIFPEQTPLRVIGLLQPDVLVKGADWRAGEIVGRKEVLEHGGKVIRVPLKRGSSTTRVIERIARAAGARPPLRTGAGRR